MDSELARLRSEASTLLEEFIKGIIQKDQAISFEKRDTPLFYDVRAQYYKKQSLRNSVKN
jgi:hypothetical protein